MTLRVVGDMDFDMNSCIKIDGPVLDMKLQSVDINGVTTTKLCYLDGIVSNIRLRMDFPDAKEDTMVACVPLARAIFNGIW